MHRFYLPANECRNKDVVLGEHESHHALDVLRVREGERVMVLDGAGQELLCEAGKAQKGLLKLAVVQRNSVPPLPCQLTLIQAVPRGKIIESIIQKATELGAHRIVPLLSDRVVTHLDGESAVSKAEKWQQVAVEAIKQCGSAWLPKVELPVTPKAYLGQGDRFELPLIASLQNDRRHPREHFKTFLGEKKRMPKSVCVWVGPEGDFTPAEMSMIKSAGMLPITLGPLVLRSETAAVYALSVLNYELQAG